MKFILKIILLSIGVFLADYLVQGIMTDGWLTVVIAGFILTIIQIIIKPVVKILTLPLTITTLGLFAIILNALFFWFVSGLVPGMVVATFTAAVLGSLVVAVFNWIADMTGDKDE